MKISAYIRPGAAVNPTGVGKHQQRMITELAKRDGVDLELIVPGRDVSLEGGSALSELGEIRIRMIPWSARNLERMWNFLNWPDISHDCRGADWFYSPFEAMPPVKKIPRIATVHSTVWFDEASPWYGEWGRISGVKRRLCARIADEAQGIMCVSEYLREKFIKAYPHSADRTHVVWNGAEEIYFTAGNMERSASMDSLIVIGPLTEMKGARLLFEVADKLKAKIPDMRILSIGGACSSPVMLQEASRHSNIELHDYLEAGKIVHLMNNALLLLQVSASESFGMPLVEAMAAGLPVLSVKAGASEEVAGDAGMMVDNGDSDGICRAISDLSGDERAVNEFREKGRARAEMFRWSTCADRLIKVMEARS